MAKSLYETLEVSENASADEIKKAYRKPGWMKNFIRLMMLFSKKLIV